MFRGGFAHSIDEKGRLIMPQKFRLMLGEKFVITRGLSRCLWVFSEDKFRELDSRLDNQPMLDPNTLALQRFFSAESVDAVTDSQGRVALPTNLREFAGIDKDVMVVGAGNRLEIWNADRWTELTNAMTDDMLTAAARAVGLG
jgi:MraZ protein